MFVDRKTIITASWLNATDAIATDPAIVALAGVTPAADQIPYFTSATVAALASFTSTGRAVVAAATPAAARGAISAQEATAAIAAIASLSPSADTMAYYTGGSSAALTPISAAARTMIGQGTNPAILSTIGGTPSNNATLTGLTSMENATVSGTTTLGTTVTGSMSLVTFDQRTTVRANAGTLTSFHIASPAGQTGGSMVRTFSNGDVLNAAYLQMGSADGYGTYIDSNKIGSGTTQPIDVQVGGVRKLRVTANQALCIGTGDPAEFAATEGNSLQFVGNASDTNTYAPSVRARASTGVISMESGLYYDSGWKYVGNVSGGAYFYALASNRSFGFYTAPANAGGAGAAATVSKLFALENSKAILGTTNAQAWDESFGTVLQMGGTATNAATLPLSLRSDSSTGTLDTSSNTVLTSGVWYYIKNGYAATRLLQNTTNWRFYGAAVNAGGDGAAVPTWTLSAQIESTGQIGIATGAFLNTRLQMVSWNNNYADVRFTYDSANNYRNEIWNKFDSGGAANNFMEFKVCDSTVSGTKTSFGMDGAGRVYGYYLHNNATAPTGTAKDFIASGKGSVGVATGTNVSAVGTCICGWTRVGRCVTVGGTCDVTTSGAGNASFSIALPVASNFAAANDAAGTLVMTVSGAASISGVVYGSAANDNAVLDFYSTGARTVTARFTYVYEVL